MNLSHRISVIILITIIQLTAQQININRIDLMSDFPFPYLMRDWREVATGYDSFVFDYNIEGQYLPLIFFRNNTINYPDDISFGLHTVVGTTSPTSGEAINVIPAVVGASLIGIDKSNQNGYDWVKMCREFFNNRPEENVYLNHPSATSGDDWWYATMPNVFFYQLYDLYPETVDFNYQLRSVADQWLRAIETMGGSDTPWIIPNMNYRGWYLSTMTPHTSGVKEPEAAGALAWLLYNAYKETREERYRIGAEWAMEFLNNYTTNPSYELQLPYGVYIAAKMNAELGTQYNIEKMINWTFDIGPLRNWGAVVGSWGGLDMHGLIGEVNGTNDYPFLMNTFQQAGALLPLLRYDDRFADALGKWMLNAANATRYFYPNFLPANKQDSEEWAFQYDPNSYIGHEAIRQSQYGSSPYATGDAIAGGWGHTNLVLYGSSHVGIFGSIIDTTDVEGILKLDLLKTDFFCDDAYPTFLFFNPYDMDKTVSLDVGSNKDIYESTSNTFISSGVSGITQITIPAKRSYIAVLTPNGGNISYEYEKLLVNGVIVDYMSGQVVTNYPPRIKALASEKILVIKNDSTNIYCTAVDKDEDNLSYQWSVESGTFIDNDSSIEWIAPNDTGKFTIQVEVSDGSETVNKQIEIHAVEKFNSAPLINKISAEPRKIDLGKTSEIECIAIDNEGDEISYSWFSSAGTITGSGSKINWTAPTDEGNYSIRCTVSDKDGASSSDSISVAVRDFSVIQTGDLILSLPFNGNVEDESGNNNATTLSGAVLTTDRFGVTQSAYKFDGINDNIRVANSTLLNFSNSITLNLWIFIDELYDREQYPISHGNWENRWKISISNDKIRWTIKTSGGITDLDSESMLQKGKWYNVTGLYSGADMELYVNGKLDAFKIWNGSINSSPVDLTIGQSVPGDNQYNFNGKIDNVQLYDYALPYDEIIQFYDLETSIEDGDDSKLPLSSLLYQNYPNPFNSQTNINFQVNNYSLVTIEIYNILGQKVITLLNEEKSPGSYMLKWNGESSAGIKVPSGVYFIRMKSDNYIGVKKAALLN
ncbi:MAG: T9SS C-terminal target domain-containing protein [Ignavibacteriales bacterium]|nr:MAG: T9SS C-terminal target domain-containing protein [Ignavibacteriales bacterium]